MSDEWIKFSSDDDIAPVDAEQRVEVQWRFENGTTTHRAGALNWSRIKAYRLLPNQPHSI